MRPGDILTASNGKTIEVSMACHVLIGLSYQIPSFMSEYY
jgi:hypothetical protein